MYRHFGGVTEVFLVHPGGPFWRNKEWGCWSIPKGEYTKREDALDAAVREFQEETGLAATGPFIELLEIEQPGGKRVRAWALAGNCVPDAIQSNYFQMEWPPGSGSTQSFPEVDRAGWFALDEAKKRIVKGQHALLDQLAELLGNTELSG